MKRRWVIAALALAGLLAGYSAFWLMAARDIAAGVEKWAAEQRAQGLGVVIGEPHLSGFPLRFAVGLDEPSLVHPADGWRWRAQRLEATAWPWSPRTVALRFSGRHAVGLLEAGRWLDFDVEIEDARARIDVDGQGRIERIAIEGRGLTVGGGSLPAPVAMREIRLEGEQAAAEGAHLRLALKTLELPPEEAPSLGATISRLELEASLRGPLAKGDLAATLPAWRDAGGSVVITGLSLDWGPLRLATSGTLTLDAALRPAGAFSAEITGYQEAIDLLVAEEIVPLGEAFMYKIALNMLAQRDANGDPVALRLPLTMENGALAVGPVRLVDLPPLVAAGPASAAQGSLNVAP